ALANPDFHPPYDVRPALLQLEKDLKYWLQNNTWPHREMMANLHEKLLTIHPFKDGNGRWSRILVEFICQREDQEIPSWSSSVTDDENRRRIYIEAVKKARHEYNYDDLIKFMF